MNIKYFDDFEGTWNDVSGSTGSTLVLNDNGEWNTSVGYKVYVALLSQTGTNDPTAVELENTIGDVNYTYDGVGSYIIDGDFPSGKTVCFVSNIGEVPGDDISIRANIDTDSIYLVTTSVSFAGTSAYSDDILKTTPIEIRVYN
jgi:hypothetical protein